MLESFPSPQCAVPENIPPPTPAERTKISLAWGGKREALLTCKCRYISGYRLSTFLWEKNDSQYYIAFTG